MYHSMTKENHSLNKQHRSHKGGIILDDQDLSTLIWIGEQSAIFLDHLRKCHGSSHQAVADASPH